MNKLENSQELVNKPNSGTPIVSESQDSHHTIDEDNENHSGNELNLNVILYRNKRI